MSEQRIAGLESRIAVQESVIQRLREDVEEMDAELRRLTSWQKYLLGAGTMTGVIIASSYRAISDWFK